MRRSRSAPRSRTARSSGKGQHLDLALLDSQIALLAYQNTNYFATGKPPKRIGNLHPNIVPYQPFRAADGELILACGNDNLYQQVLRGGRLSGSWHAIRASPPTASGWRIAPS